MYVSRVLNQNNDINNSLAQKVLIYIFFTFPVFKECIEIVVFCTRDYISRIRIRSILMEFLETSDCTDESRKDETCLQFKMRKHYIKILENNLS